MLFHNAVVQDRFKQCSYVVTVNKLNDVSKSVSDGTPLNKQSIGLHANIVLRDRKSILHVTIFWKFFDKNCLDKDLTLT